jgi:hypothetical protein
MAWRRENSWPYRDSNSGLSVVQPAASRYTDCAIPAPLYTLVLLITLSSTVGMAFHMCISVCLGINGRLNASAVTWPCLIHYVVCPTRIYLTPLWTGDYYNWIKVWRTDPVLQYKKVILSRNRCKLCPQQVDSAIYDKRSKGIYR